MVKEFPGHGAFEGTVTKYVGGVFRIEYEDGDSETLSAADLAFINRRLKPEHLSWLGLERLEAGSDVGGGGGALSRGVVAATTLANVTTVSLAANATAAAADPVSALDAVFEAPRHRGRRLQSGESL